MKSEIKQYLTVSFLFIVSLQTAFPQSAQPAIEYGLKTDKEKYEYSEPIRIEQTVRNISANEGRIYDFRDHEKMEVFLIRMEDGQKISYSSGIIRPGSDVGEALMPQQQLTDVFVAENFKKNLKSLTRYLDPGKYLIVKTIGFSENSDGAERSFRSDSVSIIVQDTEGNMPAIEKYFSIGDSVTKSILDGIMIVNMEQRNQYFEKIGLIMIHYVKDMLTNETVPQRAAAVMVNNLLSKNGSNYTDAIKEQYEDLLKFYEMKYKAAKR